MNLAQTIHFIMPPNPKTHTKHTKGKQLPDTKHATKKKVEGKWVRSPLKQDTRRVEPVEVMREEILHKCNCRIRFVGTFEAIR